MTKSFESEVPSGWREMPLASIADVRVSGVDKLAHESEEPVRLCNYIDVYKNDYITGDLQFMRATATTPEIARFGLRVGDVIITKDSETPDDIGISAVVDYAAPDLVCGYHLALIRPRAQEIDSTFLAKQLRHHRLARYFGQRANGLTRYGLPNEVVTNAPLWLPELPKQQAIGRILRSLDQAIAKTEAVIAKLKQVRAGLLQDLLTRGLDENGQLRDPVAHPEQFQDSPLGRIPRDWIFTTFATLLAERTLSDIQDGNHGELHPKESDFVDNGFPFIMATDIAAGRLDLAGCKRIPESMYKKLRVGHAQPGDVLLSHKASVGFVTRVAREDGIVMLTPQVTYYRIGRPDLLDGEFLSWLMRANRFQRHLQALAAQSTRDYVGITIQKSISIALPNRLAEQEAIALKLQSMNDLVEVEERQLSKLKNLKSGLMNDLLTGRVRVPEGIAVTG